MSKQRFITEVWDYRLSKAAPLLYTGMPEAEEGYDPETTGKNWVVCVYDKGERNTPLEVHDTGIPFIKGDKQNWQEGHDACYAFLREVRDKYSLDQIEELKPHVAEIRRTDKLRQKATDAYNKVMKEGS